MKRQDCRDPFLRGYIDAALWTSDPDPGSGDYVETGRADEMWPNLDESFLARAKADCERFETENEALLSQAGDFGRNGVDFWLTRNRHGAGFWDRQYADHVDQGLTEAAHEFGEVWLDLGQDEDGEDEE